MVSVMNEPHCHKKSSPVSKLSNNYVIIISKYFMLFCLILGIIHVMTRSGAEYYLTEGK